MNRKVQPRFFDGFKFLRISDLPANQASLFQGWATPNSFTVPTEVTSEKGDIVRYEDYDFWFDYHYSVEKDLDELL